MIWRFCIFAIFAASTLIAATSVAAADEPKPDAAKTDASKSETKQSENSELGRQVSRLVRQLNDDAAARRDAAEAQLKELAGTNAESVDRLLTLLPADSDEIPLAVRDRLAHIRREVEDRAAKAAVEATTVTLSANEMPLKDVLSAIEKQTGNKIVDRRDQPAEGENPVPQIVTLALKDAPYWSAVDQVLDEVQLGVYNYAGDDALAVLPREPGDRPRYGAAAYGGPFRIEVLEVQGERNLRKPERKALKLKLEVAWEPRLRPIAVSQAAAELTAVDDSGNKLAVSQPEAVLDSEVPGGTQATELILPLQLPPRDITKIASLKGKLCALVPGRRVKFKFTDLEHAAGKSQRRGGVQVAVDSVRKNNEIWELNMRLTLDEDNHSLESHRDWALQNVSYLEDKDGKTIDNGGFEPVVQSKNEIGLVYYFDAAEGLDGLTWVYETPAAIVELPIDYELKDIELP